MNMLYKELKITKREFEVLLLIVSGLTNKEIADKLSITVHTAKAHVRSVLCKLNVDNKIRAAVFAVKAGWV